MLACPVKGHHAYGMLPDCRRLVDRQGPVDSSALGMRGLTFELRRHQRCDARARMAKMYRVPPAGPAWHAVGARLERGVRHCCVCYRQQGWYCHWPNTNDTMRPEDTVRKRVCIPLFASPVGVAAGEKQPSAFCQMGRCAGMDARGLPNVTHSLNLR